MIGAHFGVVSTPKFGGTGGGDVIPPAALVWGAGNGLMWGANNYITWG